MTDNNKLYLVALSLGPVQDFIAAARRTRDLWFGSFLLSEISKAAALSLHKSRGAHEQAGLIFPATDDPCKDLQPCKTNLDKDGNPPFNVPNKIFAVIQTDQPQAVLAAAKAAAQTRWEELAEEPFNRNTRYLKKEQINIEIWNQQLEDVVECFAAWVEYDPATHAYDEKRCRLEQLLAARKNTRDFKPSTVKGCGIPKSSLDGLRESVIAGDWLKPLEKRILGLSAGEQLDCPGLVKRMGGEPEQFTPLSRVAVDPWLRGLDVPLPERITELVKQIHQADLGVVSRVRGEQNQQFPYDGQLLYSFRIVAEHAQIKKLQKEERKNVLQLLEQLEDQVRRFTKQHGEPSPYVAILAADGDRMGELINAATNENQHRAISLILSDFAKNVAKIAKAHDAQLIYAGGDDVLMAVPLNRVLECAKQLADDFMARWEVFKQENTNFREHNPTLSVGIGISHMLTPMGRQLDLAREAEQMAKANQHEKPEQRKNGLAMIYQPRSGDRIVFREQWSAAPEQILTYWQQLHHSRELPFRAAFQLRELGRVIGDWCTPGHELLDAEIGRVMERKRIKKDQKVCPKIIDAVCDRGSEKGLEALADELILTQKLATHTAFKNTRNPKDTDHA